MKKIITALDGLALSQSAIDYTLFIARNCNAHVVGIFLDDLMHHSYSFSDLVMADGAVLDDRVQELNRDDQAMRNESVHVFEQACQNAGLEFTVHRDRNVALQEILHESIYADLLILDSKETFTRIAQEPPTEFLRDLLMDVQCPVLVVPSTYCPPEKLVLLYDGEPASVHAVKMFSYLFPDLKYLETEVFSVKDENESVHVPDNHLMKEFMKRHFPHAEYQALKGEPEAEIITHLALLQEDTLVVLGAYQRSRVSLWFKPSMADRLLKTLKLPLFIAHNK